MFYVARCVYQNYYIPTTFEFINKSAVQIAVLKLFDFQIMKQTLGNIDQKTLTSPCYAKKFQRCYHQLREANVVMFVSFVPLKTIIQL